MRNRPARELGVDDQDDISEASSGVVVSVENEEEDYDDDHALLEGNDAKSHIVEFSKEEIEKQLERIGQNGSDHTSQSGYLVVAEQETEQETSATEQVLSGNDGSKHLILRDATNGSRTIAAAGDARQKREQPAQQKQYEDEKPGLFDDCMNDPNLCFRMDLLPCCRIACVLVGFILVALIGNNVFLMRSLSSKTHELNASRESIQKLESQVMELRARLEKERTKQELKTNSFSKSFWSDMQGKDGEDGYAHLLDNCWVRANVMLGECAKEKKQKAEVSLNEWGEFLKEQARSQPWNEWGEYLKTQARDWYTAFEKQEQENKHQSWDDWADYVKVHAAGWYANLKDEK